MGVFENLKERGFVRQTSDEAKVAALLSRPGITYYIGFDPTADSLHVGSLVPIMAMAHLQQAGHRPIAIIGGGTSMIGDPSGKTEMRRLMTSERIEANGQGILAQLQRYLVLDGKQGLFLNNADWLLPLNYIEFLRDIGRYFKINEMLRMEGYKLRLKREDGLSFIEFNYQLLQAYDFLKLFEDHDCVLQMGGDDQWGNILAGMDLIRRVKGQTAFALTFPLITTARGQKMGKTEKGTVWIDAKRTSPYEFYQYWINTDDRDVRRFLAFFTFLPIEEIDRLSKLDGEEIRQAKERLAFEVTKLAHGEKEAKKAQTTSKAAFTGSEDDVSAIPTSQIPLERFEEGIPIVDLLTEAGLVKTKSEARRLIRGGGIYLNRERVISEELTVKDQHLLDNQLMIRVGKKRYHRINAA